MQAYEKVHKEIARDIVRLPKNTTDPVCLSILGWHDIRSHVDKMKLLFVWRILSLPSSSIYIELCLCIGFFIPCIQSNFLHPALYRK